MKRKLLWIAVSLGFSVCASAHFIPCAGWAATVEEIGSPYQPNITSGKMAVRK